MNPIPPTDSPSYHRLTSVSRGERLVSEQQLIETKANTAQQQRASYQEEIKAFRASAVQIPASFSTNLIALNDSSTGGSLTLDVTTSAVGQTRVNGSKDELAIASIAVSSIQSSNFTDIETKALMQMDQEQHRGILSRVLSTVTLLSQKGGCVESGDLHQAHRLEPLQRAEDPIAADPIDFDVLGSSVPSAITIEVTDMSGNTTTLESDTHKQFGWIQSKVAELTGTAELHQQLYDGVQEEPLKDREEQVRAILERCSAQGSKDEQKDEQEHRDTPTQTLELLLVVEIPKVPHPPKSSSMSRRFQKISWRREMAKAPDARGGDTKCAECGLRGSQSSYIKDGRAYYCSMSCYY
jgi:hypothetical protein